MEGISHSFGGQEILRDISLSVTQGKSVSITSPSGGGKSTLLSILGGLMSPTSGTCCAYDQKRLSMTATFNVCSWIFQTTNALPRRSCLDNVAIGAIARGVSQKAARSQASDALEQVGLAPRRRAQARTLSGGELQRLSIARALASSQPFILADEPTGQLDQMTSNTIVECLFDAVRNNLRGLVLVTHDLDTAAMCDQQLRIVDGCLEPV